MKYINLYEIFINENNNVKKDKDKEKKDNSIDKEALKIINIARIKIVNSYPFFAELIFQLRIAESKDIPTMATDSKNILYNPTFVKSLKISEVIFIFIHEILHNIHFHFSRIGDRKKIVQSKSGKKISLWNVAGDYAINILLDKMAKESTRNIIETPDNILLDYKYEDWNTESIYDYLEKEISESEDKPQDGDGDGDGDESNGENSESNGDGDGENGEPNGDSNKGGKSNIPDNIIGDDIYKPGSFDDKGKTVQEGNEEIKDITNSKDIERKFKEIVSNAKNKHAGGSGSKSLDRWFKKLANPIVDWKKKLLKFIDNVFQPNEPDFGYFNKRYIGRKDPLYLPGLKYPPDKGFGSVILAFDTSGSVNDELLSKFLGEIFNILKIKKIETVYIIWCDHEIKGNVEKINTSDLSGDMTSKSAFVSRFLNKVSPKGGGGTDLRPPFKWVEKFLINKNIIPSFMVYFTDSFGTAPNPRDYSIPQYMDRVLWVIYDTVEAPNIRFPKDNKIFVDKSSK